MTTKKEAAAKKCAVIRVRPVSVTLVIEAVTDNGDELSQITIDPIRVPAGRLKEFVATEFDKMIESLTDQANVAEAETGK